jgi:hypothetical protein
VWREIVSFYLFIIVPNLGVVYAIFDGIFLPPILRPSYHYYYYHQHYYFSYYLLLLFQKWQDRSIGWGGTKWALRFVSLDRGRISYYYSHLENSPRYVLSLRGCTIQDEGWKRNRRHKGGITRMTKDGQPDPPLEEVGAYFFVFSICHRPHVDATTNKSLSQKRTAQSPIRSASSMTMTNPSVEFVPLIRFSTTSWAEKTQWIQLLSEACAYGETETFLQEEATRNAQEEDRRRQQAELAAAMPQAERGTLAPIYFAPTTQTHHHHSSSSSSTSDTRRRSGPRSSTSTARTTGLVRRPSLNKLPKASLYRIEAKSRDADKVESAVHGYPPSKPMHRECKASFLSTEASEQNYRGFFNLAMIILIVSNFRLLLQTCK